MEAARLVPDDVADAYGIADGHVEQMAGGRVNRTMRVRAGSDLVLQQMFGTAHGDLLGIMENLVRVTSHLDWTRKINNSGAAWYPTLVPTTKGKPFIMTADGDVWRAFRYQPGQILRSAQPLATLASAAALHGRFAAETFDLGGPPLIETTPGFHDLDRVMAELHAAVEDVDGNRRDSIAADLAMIEPLHARLVARCADDGAVWSGDRVVHNDTKLSNVVFDRDHGRATGVLDLDLLMMGPIWHDVGDLLRSVSWYAPTATPGETRSTPRFSVELFDAVAGAYAEAAGQALKPAEIAAFAVSGPRLSFELGLRYLADHLRDEPRLQVRGKNGHLIRGRKNIKLADEMLGAYDALRPVADALIESRRALRKGSP